jgi:endonuclease YncB( thermonuclease family)
MWFFGNHENCENEDINVVVTNITEEYQRKYLLDVEYDDVAFFHLNGYQTYAKIVSQYDGDTASLVFFLNGKIVKFRCRLANIDCAEKRSTNPKEVEHAMRALHRVDQLSDPDRIVYAQFHKFDKYGRLLTTLRKNKEDEFSFNETLVGEGLAYTYNGGQRRQFNEWACNDFIDQHIPNNTNVVDNINDSEVHEFYDEMKPETNISHK